MGRTPAGTPPAGRSAAGRAAERIAARYLAALGWRILDRRRRLAGGELDLVADDGRRIVFVEVRSRRRGSRFDPAALSSLKRRRISRAAGAWLAERGAGARRCRFDVIAVETSRAGARLRHVRGAFLAGESDAD